MTYENPHDVAIELERMLCDEFGFEGRPRGTIFDADEIEVRMFYDLMTLLLHKKAKVCFYDFLDSIYQYKGVDMNDIPDYKGIFQKFLSLIKYDSDS